MDSINEIKGTNKSVLGIELEDVDYYQLHPVLKVTLLTFIAVSSCVGVIGNTMVGLKYYVYPNLKLFFLIYYVIGIQVSYILYFAFVLNYISYIICFEIPKYV